jgi:hypothetical protein
MMTLTAIVGFVIVLLIAVPQSGGDRTSSAVASRWRQIHPTERCRSGHQPTIVQ